MTQETTRDIRKWFLEKIQNIDFDINTTEPVKKRSSDILASGKNCFF